MVRAAGHEFRPQKDGRAEARPPSATMQSERLARAAFRRKDKPPELLLWLTNLAQKNATLARQESNARFDTTPERNLWISSKNDAKSERDSV